MPTPRDATYKRMQQWLRLLAKFAKKRGPTIFIPAPTHRGSLGVR